MATVDQSKLTQKTTAKLGLGEQSFGILDVTLSNGKNYLFHLKDMVTQIGRQSANHLQIRDPEVSKIHCKLEATTAGILLSDMDSANGTFVNEEKIDSVTRLSTGDFLTVGPVTLKVVLLVSERALSHDPYSGEQGVLDDVPQSSDVESQSHIHYKETVEGSFLGIDDSLLQALGSREPCANPGEPNLPQTLSDAADEKAEENKSLFQENSPPAKEKQPDDQALDDFLNNMG